MNLTLRRETQDIYPGMTHLFYKEPNQTNTPIVEVIGPTASKKDGAYVWGLTFVSPKIAFTQKHIGSEYTSVIRNAKQKAMHESMLSCLQMNNGPNGVKQEYLMTQI